MGERYEWTWEDLRALEEMAFVARALGHPLRLAILEVIGEEGAYVMDLVAALERPQANISQHLMVLREAGLVVPTREGTAMRYRISNERVADLIASLRELIQYLPRPEEWEEHRPSRPWGRRFRRRGRW